MKIFDQTVSGTFYLSFAAIVAGLMTSAIVSPITRVEREGKVLLSYAFSVVFDVPEEPTAKKLVGMSKCDTCHHCGKVNGVRDLPQTERRQYMLGAIALFAVAEVLLFLIIITSVTRIFLNESVRIRTALRLMFLTVVIDVILWFAFTAVLAAKNMEYGVGAGYYDGTPVHTTNRSGFYLSLVTFLFSVVSIFLVPFVAAH